MRALILFVAIVVVPVILFVADVAAHITVPALP